jgi:hypothetical protein
MLVCILLETFKYSSREGASLELTYFDRGEQAIQQGDRETSKAWFNQDLQLDKYLW